MSEISEEQARAAAEVVKAATDHEETEWRDRNWSILAEFALQELSRREAERAERGKPIDAEWLESIGFLPDDASPGGHGLVIHDLFDDMQGDDPHFQILVSDRCRSVWIDCYDGSGDSIGLCEIGKDWNRGQLLDLLAALKGGG